MKFDPRFPRLHIVDHPLVQHKLSLMRDKRTSTRDFRELLTELAILMGYELTRDFPVALEDIETPVAKCKSPMHFRQKVRDCSGTSRGFRHV